MPMSKLEMPFKYIITGQLFSDEIYKSLLSFESVGCALYKEFVEKRLRPESTKSILEPLKKANLKTCKFANKPRKMKVHDKIVELRENCNLFARCALLKG